METCHLSSHYSIDHYSEAIKHQSPNGLTSRPDSVHTYPYNSTFAVDIGPSMGLEPSLSDNHSYETQTHLEYISPYETLTHLGVHFPPISSMVGTQTQLRDESLVKHPHLPLYMSLLNGMCTSLSEYMIRVHNNNKTF